MQKLIITLAVQIQANLVGLLIASCSFYQALFGTWQSCFQYAICEQKSFESTFNTIPHMKLRFLN